MKVILGDGNVDTSYPCCAQPYSIPTIHPSPLTLSTLAQALVTHGKSFQSEISSAFSFCARELNLVSKCRQMNKLYFEIIKSRESMGKKTKYFELKSPMQQKFLFGKSFRSENFITYFL